MPLSDDWAVAARKMVDSQLRRRDIHDGRVLEAMAQVPRPLFVPEAVRAMAWADEPLPIAAGQTISQPYIVARMAELARPGPQDALLEVGAGSGYAAAVFARLCRHVTAIERHAVLARRASDVLTGLGVGNVTVICGDGALGWPDAAPYAAIVVSAGGPDIPQPLLDQLAVGGRMVIPLGPSSRQMLTVVTRTGPKTFDSVEAGRVSFVPLVLGDKGL
jgi:protein-L-isoaspartate(D-aspartate) O-methyltransferase